MNRIAIIAILTSLVLASGCSGPESPHFVPATAGDRSTPFVKPVRAVEPPTKIPMH